MSLAKRTADILLRWSVRNAIIPTHYLRLNYRKSCTIRYKIFTAETSGFKKDQLATDLFLIHRYIFYFLPLIVSSYTEVLLMEPTCYSHVDREGKTVVSHIGLKDEEIQVNGKTILRKVCQKCGRYQVLIPAEQLKLFDMVS